MFGDLNFRIDDHSREFVIETIKKKNYSVLWDKDQVCYAYTIRLFWYRPTPIGDLWFSCHSIA